MSGSMGTTVVNGAVKIPGIVPPAISIGSVSASKVIAVPPVPVTRANLTCVGKGPPLRFSMAWMCIEILVKFPLASGADVKKQANFELDQINLETVPVVSVLPIGGIFFT